MDQGTRHTIARHIGASGQHIYLVGGPESLRYAYTIGLSDSGLPEILVAGAAAFGNSTLSHIVESLASELRRGTKESTLAVDGCGLFAISPVAARWVDQLMLGVRDYYGDRVVRAVQATPVPSQLDVPDLSTDEVPKVWRWFFEPWPFSAPLHSIAVTDLGVLRGEPVAELARWEHDQWEMFSGPASDVAREDVRVVPLRVLAAADCSLADVVDIGVGEARWRIERGPWQVWRARIS